MIKTDLYTDKMDQISSFFSQYESVDLHKQTSFQIFRTNNVKIGTNMIANKLYHTCNKVSTPW